MKQYNEMTNEELVHRAEQILSGCISDYGLMMSASELNFCLTEAATRLRAKPILVIGWDTAKHGSPDETIIQIWRRDQQGLTLIEESRGMDGSISITDFATRMGVVPR